MGFGLEGKYSRGLPFAISIRRWCDDSFDLATVHAAPGTDREFNEDY